MEGTNKGNETRGIGDLSGLGNLLNLGNIGKMFGLNNGGRKSH